MQRAEATDGDSAGAVDPARCPLCGQPNACGRLDGAAGPCWCAAERFTPALLAAVPEAAVRKACICRDCAARGTPP